jgi:hypothetical protein
LEQNAQRRRCINLFFVILQQCDLSHTILVNRVCILEA